MAKNISRSAGYSVNRWTMVAFAISSPCAGSGLFLTASTALATTQFSPTYLTTSGTYDNEPWTLEGVNNAGDAGYGSIFGAPGEDRAIMEFSLAGITPANIGSAVLTPYAYSVTGSTFGSDPVPLEFYTYLGNGMPNASYGSNTDSETAVATTAPNNSVGYLNINVTSEIEQALAAGAQYIGFATRATQPNGDVEFNGGFFSGPSSYLAISTSPLLSIGSKFTATTDSEIDAPANAISFLGGTLTAAASFNTSRATTINSSGGTIDVAPGVTFGLQSTSLSWGGGILNVIDSGTLDIGVPSGSAVLVPSGSSINIASNASVTVDGNTDPFTDSTSPVRHVTVINHGSLNVNTNSTVAVISDSGAVTIGQESIAILQLAVNGGASSVSSLTVNTGSSLDLTNNHLFINYGTGPDPITSIAALISSGYSGETWTGPGIMSTVAQINSGSYGIGYADSTDPGNPAGLAAGQIEIKYTLLGDANLDGAVNGTDFAILASNFNKADQAGHSDWDEGDFNYDGSINGADFASLAANFNKGASQSDVAILDSFVSANGLLADVPEPASVALAALTVCGFGARRRRTR
jgi:hypothetical protein